VPGRTWGNKRAQLPVATENGRLTRPIGSSTFRFARLNLLSVGDCREQFELKSQKRTFGRKIVDGAFATMSKRISDKANAKLLLLQYDREALTVRNLIVVPKHFFTSEMLERRKPLTATARRAGWVATS
jgi:hypothetical protein